MAWTLDNRVGNYNVRSINSAKQRKVKNAIKASRKSRKQRQADFADQVESAIEAGIPVTIIPYQGKPKWDKPRKRDKIAELEATIATLKKERPKPPVYRSGMGSEFYLTREWRSIRFDVIRASDGKCKLCGMSRDDGVIMHVDHIKPRSKFPELELVFTNLQLLCEDCNLGKSNK